MIKYVDFKGDLLWLEITTVDQVEDEVLNRLEGSVGRFCEVHCDWLKRKGWQVCYSRDGDFETYDMVSLIRYCKRKKIEKMLALSVFFIMDRQEAAKARVFNATWTGLCQALWGAQSDGNMPMLDALNMASVEPFLIIPDERERCEFILLRELGEGVVLAGPDEFLEYMVSRSKGEWYVGNSLEFRSEEEVFKAQKDRKTAIQDEKMERD